MSKDAAANNAQTPNLAWEIRLLLGAFNLVLSHWHDHIKGNPDALLPGMSDGEEMEAFVAAAQYQMLRADAAIDPVRQIAPTADPPAKSGGADG